MSVEATSWVWSHSQARGTTKFVLVRIADMANKDGTDAWPSVETIARDCGLSARTVHSAIAKLVDLGELVVYYGAGGNSRVPHGKRPNRYDLPRVPDFPGVDFDLLETHPKPSGRPSVTPAYSAPLDLEELAGVTPADFAGVGVQDLPGVPLQSTRTTPSKTCTQSIHEPPVEPSTSRSTSNSRPDAANTTDRPTMVDQRVVKAVHILAKWRTAADPSVRNPEAFTRTVARNLLDGTTSDDQATRARLVDLADRHPHLDAEQLARACLASPPPTPALDTDTEPEFDEVFIDLNGLNETQEPAA